MKIPHTITECYQALGLVSKEKELAKGLWDAKAKLCKRLIKEFFVNDSGNYIFEEQEGLQQFQERAVVWVNFYASRLWAQGDRESLCDGAPTYPQDKPM